MFAGTSRHGLFHSSDQGQNWSRFPSAGLPDNVSISDVILDAQGRILIGTFGDGIFGFEAGRWVSIDPSRPEVLTVNQLFVDPRNLQIAYAVVPNGIYRLNETGRWEKTLNLGTPIVSVLLIDPTDSRVWYLGTSMGLIRSSDAGATWLTVTLQNTNIIALAVAPSDPARLYAGTSNGLLYRSSDQGMHWSTSIEIVAEGKISVLAVSPTSPSTLFAGTSDGLYMSENDGENWHIVLPQPSWRNVVIYAAGIGATLAFALLLAIFVRGRVVKSDRRERPSEKKLMTLEPTSEKPMPEALASQVQEAFDSLKRSERADRLLAMDRLERLYVDYSNNLESLLQPRDDYIVGHSGAGKTTLFFRGFAECRRSWAPGYTDRQMRFLREPNTLAIYLTLKEFELASFSLGSTTAPLEAQLVQAVAKSLLEQVEGYPPSLGRKVRRLFGSDKWPTTIPEFLEQLQTLQEVHGIPMVHLLIDDFSVLGSGFQIRLASVLRRIIFHKRSFYLKLAVVPNEFNLGEIERQRDMFELSLSLSDLVRRSAQPTLAYRKILEISDKLIDRRLHIYTDGTLSSDDILGQSRAEIIRTVVDRARGIPRTMGLILSQSWREVTSTGEYVLEQEDLWTPPSSPTEV